MIPPLFSTSLDNQVKVVSKAKAYCASANIIYVQVISSRQQTEEHTPTSKPAYICVNDDLMGGESG